MKRPHRGMIVNDWRDSAFTHNGTGYCPDVTVDHNPSYRVSEVLGPDGNPLLVGYSRPMVGFDLRPKGKP